MVNLEVQGHCMALLHHLYTLLETGTMCDVTLQASDRNIRVHKLVLVASSPFFADLIVRSTKSSLQLRSYSGNVLKIVVNFMYLGTLQVSPEDIDDVISLCKDFQLMDALKLCNNYKEKVKGNSQVANELKAVDESNHGYHISLQSSSEQNEEFIERFVENDEPVRIKKQAAVKGKSLKAIAKSKKTRKRAFKGPKQKHKRDIVEYPKNANIVYESQVSTIKMEVDETNYKADDNANTKKIEESSNSTDKEHVNFSVTENTYDTDTDDFEISSDFEKAPETKKESIKTKETNKTLQTGEKPKRVYKKREREQVPCSVCSKVLSSRKRKVFHEFSKHGIQYDAEKYNMTPCEMEGCTYVASNRHNLKAHMKSRHSEARPHVCEFCGKAFKLANILRTHLNIHSSEKTWQCLLCDEGFNQQSGLDIHIKRHHIGEKSWSELCHLCSEKFMLKSDLSWHLFKAHGQPLPENYKVYQCDQCSFMTKSCKDFERHENIHKGIKKYMCGLCQKACSTNSELKRHVSFHGEKKFKCPFEGCQFACTDQIGLQKHQRLMHTHKDVKPFACPICHYRTGVKGNVDKHIRTVHDLVVVTKHTVALKMKYAQFDSGDVITKDGQLVAAASLRKSLQEGPPLDKDGNIVTEIEESGPSEKEYYMKNEPKCENTKQEQYDNSVNISNAQGISSGVMSNLDPSEYTAAVMNLMPNYAGIVQSQNGRDLTMLTNFVYINGSQALQATSEAEDLRMPTCNANGVEQMQVFNLEHGDVYISNL
ncbi:myoneurin-like [Dreissena polymorpha]|uniref:myoneurin-like n=1 Tax=Dreissena polymorpha TaxID=45954 RepID=UPI0022650383|nr:myoneurin-like [Dreissena polymorpha]XP_052243030.1 myoneurin-like [Dreissena polymorpha]